jgi:hypothetical protein
MPANKRPIAGEASSDDGRDDKNFDPATPPIPSRARRIGADKIAQALCNLAVNQDLAPRLDPPGDIASDHWWDTPPGRDDPWTSPGPDDPCTSPDNPFQPPLEDQARRTLYYYDGAIRIPMDIPLSFIPQDNTAFLLLTEALKPTLREIIQADPKFPHGKHDGVECESILESFIGDMLEQDPAGHTPRWATFDAVPPGGPWYFAVWLARCLVDYLKVDRRRR